MTTHPTRPRPRVVVGLLAHERPDQVRKLIEALASDDIVVVLHVDARSPIPVAEFVPDGAHVVLVDHRVKVWWGDVSVVDAITAIMRVAAELEPDYFSLISGACWPTRSPEDIVERLCGDPAAGHLGAEPLRKGWWTRLDRFHLSRPAPKLVKMGAIWIGIRLPARDRSRIPPAYGMNCWLDLRGDVLAWVVDQLDRDPGYRRAYRLTHLTDEIFFNTLLMNSSFAPEISVVVDPEDHLYGLRYIRWGSRHHPETLTDDDLVRASQLDCIFARKV
ncbi:MAG: beta-1,6-N-acetylglucosaminyltransferase [Acidimicrobiales bacterium]